MPNRVIARFRDGRMIKGTTINFSPESPHFHILPPETPYGEGQRVDVRDLKAIFFVRDLRGNPLYAERKEFVAPPGYGHRMLVEFGDGEEMIGVVHNVDRRKPGFFLFPSDPASNNERVFAIFDFVKRIEELGPDEVRATHGEAERSATSAPPDIAEDPFSGSPPARS